MPADVRRVFVGRLELIGPDDLSRAEARLAALPAEAGPDEVIASLGRFSEPLLRRLASGAGRAQVRTRAGSALRALVPATTPSP